MRTAPSASHQARSTISSPSSRKVRVSPLASASGSLPPRLISSSEPRPVGAVGRQGPCANQVAGLEIAAVRAVVRDDLRRAPVHGGVGRAAREDVRRECPRRASARSISVTSSWIARAATRAIARHRRDKASGLRIAGGPWRHRLDETARAHRGSTIHGTDAGQEILGEERAERLVFPSLQVARRPVVREAIAGDMVVGLADRNRRSRVVSAADPDARARARNRGGGSGHIPARRRPAACAGRSGGSPARPTAAPSSPARDSRSAHIYNWAAADCRAGTACRHWSRDGCRRRSRCSRRRGTARCIRASLCPIRWTSSVVAIAFVAEQFGQPQPRNPADASRPAREPGVEHRLRKVVAPFFVEKIGGRRRGRG